MITFMAKSTKERTTKKKIVFVSILIVLTAFGIIYFVTIVLDKNKDTKSTDKTEQLFDESLTQTLNGINAYTEKTAKENQELVNNVQNVDDIKKIEESKKSEIGLQKINTLIADKKNDEVTPYIDYVMTFDDSNGIGASTICYKIATDEARKQMCTSRLKEQLVSQGIIKPNEPIPANYLDLNPEERG